MIPTKRARDFLNEHGILDRLREADVAALADELAAVDQDARDEVTNAVWEHLRDIARALAYPRHTAEDFGETDMVDLYALAVSVRAEKDNLVGWVDGIRYREERDEARANLNTLRAARDKWQRECEFSRRQYDRIATERDIERDRARAMCKRLAAYIRKWGEDFSGDFSPEDGSMLREAEEIGAKALPADNEEQ